MFVARPEVREMNRGGYLSREGKDIELFIKLVPIVLFIVY